MISELRKERGREGERREGERERGREGERERGRGREGGGVRPAILFRDSALARKMQQGQDPRSSVEGGVRYAHEWIVILGSASASTEVKAFGSSGVHNCEKCESTA